MYLKCTDLLKITYPHWLILPLLLPMKVSESFGFFCSLQLLKAVSWLVAPLNGLSMPCTEMPCNKMPRADLTLGKAGKIPLID